LCTRSTPQSYYVANPSHDPPAASQRESADLENIGMTALLSRTKGRRAAKRQRSVVLKPHSETFLPPPAGLGKHTFSEAEKGRALEKLRHMRTLVDAVRELGARTLSSGQPHRWERWLQVTTNHV
jgi:hypothetical protein